MRRRRSRSTLAVAVLATALLLGSAPPPVGAQATGLVYEPPVAAPVLDPYRPPAHPYAPGNRGIEYGTAPGESVRAAADGEVVFAGQVAGSLHVTVRHADGVRTTYSFLAHVTVGLGATVRRGEVVGVARGPFHFGARVGEEYIDPALLFARPEEIRLAPIDDGAVDVVGERAALLRLAVEVADLGGRAASRLESAVHAARELGRVAWEDLSREVPILIHYAIELDPHRRARRAADRLARWAARRDECTPADAAVPPPDERRIAVLVAGLGSSSGSGSVDEIDTAALGYEAADVVRFSHGGGRTPAEHDGSLADLPTSTYEREDTEVDMSESGRELLALLEAIAAREPGVPIDVFAHSQGGVVAHDALRVGEETSRLPDALDTVVTFGSPHQGSDLATGITVVEGRPKGSAYLDLIERRLQTHLDPASTASVQLSETSGYTRALGGQPPPEGIELRSIAARGDLTVTAGHTALPGVEPVILDDVGPDAHGGLPGSPAATREAALALAGMPPTCTGLADAVADVLVSEAISWGEDAVGFVVWSASVP